ncbi:MFS transporter [Geosmithia morbida]|uniref:MFS transporter n=1 Tax=Geosmithia morbida TaxID=1094350 RepID=A0A9P4Z2C6_9HYPO|nr:MFS transporter [Geosmithia morbida]KAF4126161.1 MFS transporter [Geosmithia morbida]
MSNQNSDEKPGIDTVESVNNNLLDTEKGSTARIIDDIRVIGLTEDEAEFYASFSPQRRKNVTKKIDRRLVPILAILYLISHIDRANIGNAKIEGLNTDLGLNGLQWNIVLSLFFVPYVLLEVPSNILLKKFSRPSRYLGTLVMIWGIIMTLHGVVQNFGGLLAVRLLLGTFEAGFFPGAVYLCTFWYMPRDLSQRISWFYCTSALSGAFSGLLAAAIAKMDGVGGYEGWRWIFLLEGIATVFLGVATFLFLIDSPALSTKWLDADEIRFLELQLCIKQGGRQVSGETVSKFRWDDLWAVLGNWRIYLQICILLCNSACSYGTKFTLPSIAEAMGFQNTDAQLMTAPPYICGAISTLIFSRLSDRFYWRMPFIFIPLLFIAVGYSILIGLKGDLEGQLGASYTAVILTCIGIFPLQPIGSSWNANNIAPTSRRAIGVAFNIASGNIGGIIGSYIYLDRESPYYWTGFGVSLGISVLALVASVVLELSYKTSNDRKANLTEEDVRSKYSEEDLLRLGDKSPLFKYIL